MPTVKETFERMPSRFLPEEAGGVDATIQYDITGDQGGTWHAVIKDQALQVRSGAASNPNLTLTVSAQDWIDMVGGKLSGPQAYAFGKLQLKGDIGLAVQVGKLFRPATPTKDTSEPGDDSATGVRPSPVEVGDRAPDFSLPAVNHEGTISLAEFRGRSPVLLALFVGLWCPFCRRAIAQMGMTESALKTMGVETIGVVATPVSNARLYFRYRPTRMRLAADPGLATHRAYGVPSPAHTPELARAMAETRINPTGELPEPLPIHEAFLALGRLDGYAPTETDQADYRQQSTQLKGVFLIDREGVVRWTNVECREDGLPGLGKFPSQGEIVAAVRALSA